MDNCAQYHRCLGLTFGWRARAALRPRSADSPAGPVLSRQTPVSHSAWWGGRYRRIIGSRRHVLGSARERLAGLRRQASALARAVVLRGAFSACLQHLASSGLLLRWPEVYTRGGGPPWVWAPVSGAACSMLQTKAAFAGYLGRSANGGPRGGAVGHAIGAQRLVLVGGVAQTLNRERLSSVLS